MNNARDRRLKATGKWFQKTNKKNLWINNIFSTFPFSFYIYRSHEYYTHDKIFIFHSGRAKLNYPAYSLVFHNMLLKP